MTEDELVAAYIAGASGPELAERSGHKLGRVYAILRKHGIKMRGFGSPIHTPPPVFDKPADEDVVVLSLDRAYALLKRGYSLDEVAERFDAETDDLRKALKRAGYKIPGHRDPNDPERVAKRRTAQRREERRAAERRNTARKAREKKAAEQARARELTRRFATARRYAALREGEIEFERRERSQLRDWLAEYSDVLTDIPDPWVVHLRELQAMARTVNGVTPHDAPERRASEELSKLLADALASGQSAYGLAKLLGVTPAAVTLRIQRHGYAPMYPSQGAAYKGADHG